MYIDYLADDLVRPLWVFLNTRITQTGLIPEIIVHSNGEFKTDRLTLWDKNKVKVCEVAIAPSLRDYLHYQEGQLSPLLIINTENEEFKLTKIEIEDIELHEQ